VGLSHERSDIAGAESFYSLEGNMCGTAMSQDIATLELPADNHLSVSIHAVNLKNRLGDVETNRRNRLHGKLLRIVGALNGAHIFGALVPVEEPSTASGATFCTAEKRSISASFMFLLISPTA
jgi:hypothetical protein